MATTNLTDKPMHSVETEFFRLDAYDGRTVMTHKRGVAALLENKSNQLNSLLTAISSDGCDFLDKLEPIHRGNILWIAQELAEDINNMAYCIADIDPKA